MNGITSIKAAKLLSENTGTPGVRVGLIDGPVAVDHPGFERADVRLVSRTGGQGCAINHSSACMHGTQVAGILVGERGGGTYGICPDCTLLVYPIFRESPDSTIPSDTSALARAIITLIAAGADIISLSLGLEISSNLRGHADLVDALDLAANKRVLVVAAAGNQGTVGSTDVTRHSWVIPVVAYNQRGLPMAMSNLSASIGKNGVGAPGDAIPTLLPNGRRGFFSGTSAATPVVTGILALLLGRFLRISPGAIKKALLFEHQKNRRSIVPPLLNADRAYHYLKNQ